MGGVQQRKGFAAGGGDGIDQIKYFTTHFRRCARRVVRGGAEPGDYGAAEKKCSTILRDGKPRARFSPVEYGFSNVYKLSGDFQFHN